MRRKIDVQIVETSEYGAVLTWRDLDVADKFEDYLTEQCFVLFNVKFAADEVSFFFGQASALSKVQDLYDGFANSML